MIPFRELQILNHCNVAFWLSHCIFRLPLTYPLIISAAPYPLISFRSIFAHLAFSPVFSSFSFPKIVQSTNLLFLFPMFLSLLILSTQQINSSKSLLFLSAAPIYWVSVNFRICNGVRVRTSRGWVFFRVILWWVFFPHQSLSFLFLFFYHCSYLVIFKNFGFRLQSSNSCVDFLLSILRIKRLESGYHKLTSHFNYDN